MPIPMQNLQNLLKPLLNLPNNKKNSVQVQVLHAIFFALS